MQGDLVRARLGLTRECIQDIRTEYLAFTKFIQIGFIINFRKYSNLESTEVTWEVTKHFWS